MTGVAVKRLQTRHSSNTIVIPETQSSFQQHHRHSSECWNPYLARPPPFEPRNVTPAQERHPSEGWGWG